LRSYLPRALKSSMSCLQRALKSGLPGELRSCLPRAEELLPGELKSDLPRALKSYLQRALGSGLPGELRN
jgi:hypothetical protein